jgi:hypothetical protein
MIGKNADQWWEFGKKKNGVQNGKKLASCGITRRAQMKKSPKKYTIFF